MCLTEKKILDIGLKSFLLLKVSLYQKCPAAREVSPKKQTNELIFCTQTAFRDAKRHRQKNQIRSFVFWENPAGHFEIN